MQGRLGEAEHLLRELGVQDQGNALVWYNLGNVLRDQKRASEALGCYARAVQLEPGLVEAHNNAGSLLHAQYRWDEAEREYGACLALAPDHLTARLNLASLLIDIGKFRDAELLCREIVDEVPDLAVAHTFLGAALDHQGKVREALQYQRAAARLDPFDAHAAENLATALAQVGELDAALREFARALALRPDSASTRHARACVLLSAGRLPEGWADYGYRPAFTKFQESHPHLVLTRSLSHPLLGKSMCLLPEQGLGDELFFLRFAPSLGALGARVTYRASQKVRSLLMRSNVAHVVAGAETAVPPEALTMLIGDVPHALSSVLDRCGPGIGVPSYPPSLTVQPLATELPSMHARLRAAGSPPYTAVTWRGGVPPREQRTGHVWGLHKEIGIVRLATALRDLPGTVVAIQRNPEPGEVDEFSTVLGRRVLDCCALNADLEVMAALLALADEYVGVSNTNMHLRASVGRTARVLVPCPAEWRWMAAGDSSPWFPGFSVYRQSADGEWGEALAALARDLTAAF
jgi:tetratricopeptide (TPR) repeat protein